MKFNRYILIVLLSLLSLTGCNSDIEIKHSSDSSSKIVYEESEESKKNAEESTSSTNIIETPEKNLTPQVGERFYAYPFVTSGTLYVTVTEPEYFTNINDANINIDCFRQSIKEYQLDSSLRYYDEETGSVLNETFTNTPRVFVKATITIENIDAISFWQKTEKGLRGIDPMFKDGYCGQYDFSGNDFGIGVIKETNAYDKLNTTGTGVDYFSLSGQLYSDEYRFFMYNLESIPNSV